LAEVRAGRVGGEELERLMEEEVEVEAWWWTGEGGGALEQHLGDDVRRAVAEGALHTQLGVRNDDSASGSRPPSGDGPRRGALLVGGSTHALPDIAAATAE